MSLVYRNQSVTRLFTTYLSKKTIWRVPKPILCASCHGIDGYAQPDARYASIVGLSSIRRVKPDALIGVIAFGAKGAFNTAPKMPGFSKDLSPTQIASITNYVRVTFGGLPGSDVSAADVTRVIKEKS